VDSLTSVKSEFYLLVHQPVQEAVLETVEATNNFIAKINQSELEFSIRAHSDFYIDPNIHIYMFGQLLASDGKALDANDRTAINNNFLHSKFLSVASLWKAPS
jgi:hypothetical protein